MITRRTTIGDLNNIYEQTFNSERFDSVLLPTICAFLNTDGGTIHFGYNGRNICGLKEPDSILNSIKSAIRNSETIKKYNNCIDVYQNSINGKYVVCVLVNKARSIGFVHIDGKYYFRIGDKNIIVSKEEASYTEKIALFGLPRIKDFSPKFSEEKEELTQLKKKNSVVLKVIGELKNKKINRLFKHLDLEAAMLSLTNGNMRFYEPSNWDDDYECRFYNADYRFKGNPVKKELTPLLYATCFASSSQNEAAWVLYSHNQTGLASRCVQIEINFKEFRKQLVKNAQKKMIYFGAVNYGGTFMINHLHEPTIEGHDNRYYHSYFDNFSLECYLNLLLLKRTIFEHEKEIRLFIIPNPRTKDSKNKKTRKTGEKTYEGNSTPLVTEIKIDWSEVIEKVRIDKDSTSYEKSILQKELDKLYKRKLRKAKTKSIPFDEKKEKAKITLSSFDPYEDKSLTKGPISIAVN